MPQSETPHWQSALALLCATPIFFLDVAVDLLSFAWLTKLLTDHRGLQSVAVGEATERHGAPRRSAASPDALVAGQGTVYDVVAAAVRRYGPAPALRTRRFVALRKLKETDRFPTKVFDDDNAASSPFDSITYDELGERLLNFGAGLRQLGMEPIPPLKDPAGGGGGGAAFDAAKGPFCMVIFEDTCPQWTTALQGAFSQSLTVATCYATLGDDAVVAAVNETSATTLLLNWKAASAFAKQAAKMPTLRTIIASTHEMPANTPTPQAAAAGKVRIITSDDVLALGAQHRATFPPVPPQPSDVAVIMYTSGSTGQPKGVVMQHRHIVAGVTGMAMNVTLRPGAEVYVSYLPLAHILALQIENALLSAGATICYADPRELSKAMPLFRPTLFAGVPKVWDLLQNGLRGKMDQAGGPVKLLFDTLLHWKLFVLQYGGTVVGDTPVSNIFFKTVSRKVFGGVLQFGVSGGGPLTASLHDFCRAVFCCPVIQGYALTETCVGGCFQAVHDARSGVVGPPVPCVEIMLQSEPDIKDSGGLPYLHTDKVGSRGEVVLGRGEICMRGPCVSAGYYKDPAKTQADYDADGWFHTGDVGQFTSDGVIQIVDRKKNLVKLRGGEYVAVESMESAYNGSAFVHAVCVIANGDLDAPLAFVNANVKYLEQWAAQNGVAHDSVDDLAEKDDVRAAIVKSMVQAGQTAGLTALELRLRDVCVVTKEWGPGTGLTASMKLDRRQISSMHDEGLQAMLKRNKM